MGTRLTSFSFEGKSLVTEVFLETGTFWGETLWNAYKAGFPMLYSIEYLKENYEIACAKFRGIGNVRILLGSSPAVLPGILNGKRSTTFWLDAHYQDRTKAELDSSFGECPLLAELDEIRRVDWQTPPFILIDDAHMFTGGIVGNFDPAQWPSLDEIEAALPANYVAQICDDVIYCFSANPG